MCRSKNTAKLPDGVFSNYIVSFYGKVCSSPYCCAVLLDPCLKTGTGDGQITRLVLSFRTIR